MDEFLECVKDKDANELVTVVCGDCVLQMTLLQFKLLFE